MSNLALQITQSNIGDPNVGANVLYNTTIPFSEEGGRESILLNLNISYDLMNTYRNFKDNFLGNVVDAEIIEDETAISWLDTLNGISNFNIIIPFSEDENEGRNLTLGMSGNPLFNVIKNKDLEIATYASIGFINNSGSLTTISITCDDEDRILSFNYSRSINKKISGYNVCLNALLIRTINLNNPKTTIQDRIGLISGDTSNFIIGGRFQGFIRQITIPLDVETILLITLTIGLE